MTKSFYHVIDWTESRIVIDQLMRISVLFSLEQPSWLQAGQIAVVFPDLPVRQYGEVLQVFGNHGQRYPFGHGSLP